MIILTAVVGYLLGSIPTAEGLGRLWGVRLRVEGSTNPGTANALRVSGPWLAAIVLLVEAAKGYAAVELGSWMADDWGAVIAGVTAVSGNAYNVWYRFEGGKGLGISFGVLAAVWPLVLPVAIAAIALAVLITRASGLSALWAVAALLISSVLWALGSWPTGGIEPGLGLVVLASGIAVLVGPKHLADYKLKGSDHL